MHNLHLLCQSDTIYMDGTFKMALEMFSQIYSIHICYLGTMLPMAIRLLPAKTQQTYLHFLRLVSEAAMRYGMQFQSHTVCIDFKSAMIAAVPRSLEQCLYLRLPLSFLASIVEENYKILASPSVTRRTKHSTGWCAEQLLCLLCHQL